MTANNHDPAPGAGAAPHQKVAYQLHLDAQTTHTVNLDIHTPVYAVIEELAARHLPATANARDYKLFGGEERRPISREVTLARTPYAQGGDLFLAAGQAPWWAPPPAIGSNSVASRPVVVRTPQHLGGIIGIGGGVAVIGLLALLFWMGGQAPPPVNAPTPGLALVQDAATPIVAPTATLLPQTPTPLPTPTPDAATRASLAYRDGVQAYSEQDWPGAAELLQQVYDYNPAYLDIREVLAATYYNWGIALRDQNDIAVALERFQAAVAVEPAHPLAPAEQARAQLYLDALAALERDDADAAIEQYRALLAAQGGDYAGASQTLYDLLLSRAAALEAAGGRSNLEAARSLYREAAGLTVADTTQAATGAQRVTRLLPTPVPPTPVPPRPVGRSFVVSYRNSFENTGNSGEFASCIDIKVVGKNGPIRGAVLGINNGQGQSFENTTDQNGYAARCGLGASNWSVVLFWAPPSDTIRNAVTTVYVNGAAHQRAGVNFNER